MATMNRTLNVVLSPREKAAVTEARGAPPGLLRCLVASPCAERRRLIRAAAESQAWDAIVCRDAGEFLRTAFKRSVPLLVVDLPSPESPHYWDLREATDRAKQSTSALLVIAGCGGAAEEVWARGLGVWGYLSEADSQRGFEFVFNDARCALRAASRSSRRAAPCAGGWLVANNGGRVRDSSIGVTGKQVAATQVDAKGNHVHG